MAKSCCTWRLAACAWRWWRDAAPQMELFAVLCLPIFWPQYIRQKRLRSKQGIIEAIAFVLPVILVALGLMAYNAARFGSPFDLAPITT